MRAFCKRAYYRLKILYYCIIFTKKKMTVRTLRSAIILVADQLTSVMRSSSLSSSRKNPRYLIGTSTCNHGKECSQLNQMLQMRKASNNSEMRCACRSNLNIGTKLSLFLGRIPSSRERLINLNSGILVLDQFVLAGSHIQNLFSRNVTDYDLLTQGL